MNAILNKLKSNYITKFFSLATILVLVFSFCSITNVAAQALSQQQIEDLDSGILYFDTDTCGSSTTSSTSSTTSTSSSPSTSLGVGSSVYILGDSITDRAASAYESTFQAQGITANLDFSDGRGIVTPGNGDTANTNNLTGLQAATQDASEIQKAGAIVIALGTNDVNNEDTAQNIDQLISTIRSENAKSPIYWVDVYAIDSSILTSAQVGQINSTIYGETAKDNYQIIPWFNTVDTSGNSENPSNPEVDPNQYIDMTDGYGVHPDPAGATALAKLVVSKVTGNNPSSSSSSSNDSSSCCNGQQLASGPSAGGPLLDVQFPEVADVTDFATNINNYIQKYYPSSPYVGMGSTFVAAGQKYDVNPALMIGIAVKESTLGTDQPSGSYDAFGLTQAGDSPSYPFINGIINFPSWTVGVYGEAEYIGEAYAQPGSEYYSTTIIQLMSFYTPNTRSDPAPHSMQQAELTLSIMQIIVNGLSTTGSGSTPTTTSTTTSTATPDTDTTGGSSCTSSSSTSTTSTTSGLSNPFPDGWTPGRLDMGYDGHFTTEIVAPCSGTMSYVDPDSDHAYNGGWYGAYFTLQCSQTLSGISAVANTFYFAEGVQPTVTQGQTVTAGQQIGVPGWTGYTEGPGGIEWGLAVSNEPQLTYANSLGDSCIAGTPSQQMVMNFSQWFQQNLQVAAPATTDHAGCA